MIVYLNKTKNGFEITHSPNSEYQVIIPRVKNVEMTINKPDVKLGYKNININSKEAVEIKEFLLYYFKQIIKAIDNQLVEN